MAKKQISLIAALALVGGLIGGVVSSQFLMGKPAFAKKKSQKVVEAEEFRLVDENGKLRAKLAQNPKLVGFGLVDKKRNLRLVLNAVESGSTHLKMYDPGMKERVSVMLTEDGMPLLDLRDRNGKAGLSLRLADGDTPILEFRDRDNKVRLNLVLVKGDIPYLLFLDRDQKAKAVFGVQSNGMPQMQAIGSDDKVIWQVPEATVN